MSSEIFIALVVLVAIAAHVALYRWVKFKIHEGVILQFFRDRQEEGAGYYHHAEVISAHTDIPVGRLRVVCRKSKLIQSDPHGQDGWRAT